VRATIGLSQWHILRLSIDSIWVCTFCIQTRLRKRGWPRQASEWLVGRRVGLVVCARWTLPIFGPYLDPNVAFQPSAKRSRYSAIRRSANVTTCTDRRTPLLPEDGEGTAVMGRTNMTQSSIRKSFSTCFLEEVFPAVRVYVSLFSRFEDNARYC